MDKIDKNNIKFTNIFKKTSIDDYIVIYDKKVNKNINKFPKIPKVFFKDLKSGVSHEKVYYNNDNSTVQFFISSNINKTFGRIGKNVRSSGRKTLVYLHDIDPNIIKNQVINFILGYYNFEEYKSDKVSKLAPVYIYHSKKGFDKIIKEAMIIANIQNELRSLINMPANDLTTVQYAKYIKANTPKKIKVKIYDEKQLKKMGCNLILGVNSGSKYPARMVVLEYKNLAKVIGKKSGKSSKSIITKNKLGPVAMIGKGVMFDSGGLNLKTGDFSDMKTDMAGSAIVYGTITLLEKFQVKGHYIGILPLVENMVDAGSTRPGDVLKAYNGKTVEIVDTDAEGRLIMADALAFSKTFNPSLCIDIATLTGQAAAIFGGKAAVVMGNNNKLVNDVIIAGKENNEKFWELPMWKEYVDLTKSNIADYKNYTYGASAGTIMAGAFLSNFVPEKTNWIHLDIAGVDFLRSDTVNRFSGASAESFRSLFTFVADL